VVIGRFQPLRNEVDAEAAQRHGIQVVRRISGGGAMFIEPGNTPSPTRFMRRCR
jgi:lipoate-protein ligase A